ncbi:hypothetical protein [Mycobacteroides abscessus]|uniref:hypothetical protein n=1 Tax=Mycobacteroides abscessus TaxID=36809 RepID=UPI000927E1ED|nr:hypothetical protein [Mycobacteroides abscessus]SHO82450.1 Uncharacterised protein [Mycobacteroides abscessus subsp. abscessus]SHP25341.1 Uncharacterised protein [Mycobacteroides abscessus subsp. abscessus]SHP72629.1 Uncharacterised protein [Mycobacteroides abscessus subsp. abscessus]SHQ91896.1 Uncharacterised protein [Mycobacteroides abscessus subsp. abscessus]SHR00470.1 Uncharacterised protein [Mycobacteroides abscessus subsp. abscessus]
MGQVLAADLAALGKLAPEIESLIADLKSKMPTAPSPPANADPAIAAMHSLSTAMHDRNTLLATWMSALAQVIAAFQKGLVLTEEQGIALMRAIGNVLHA